MGDNADLPATSTDASADAPSQLGRTSLIQEIQPPPAENSSGTSQASPSTKSGASSSIALTSDRTALPVYPITVRNLLLCQREELEESAARKVFGHYQILMTC